MVRKGVGRVFRVNAAKTPPDPFSRRLPPRRHFGAPPICRQARSSHGRHLRGVSPDLLRSSGIFEVEGKLPFTLP
jgi:hypothetical protein